MPYPRVFSRESAQANCQDVHMQHRHLTPVYECYIQSQSALFLGTEPRRLCVIGDADVFATVVRGRGFGGFKVPGGYRVCDGGGAEEVEVFGASVGNVGFCCRASLGAEARGQILEGVFRWWWRWCFRRLWGLLLYWVLLVEERCRG